MVIIVFKATRPPIKYDPLSPKKILEFGKLNNKNDNKIINWPIKKTENSVFPASMFMYNNIVLIIIRLIARSPLKPSIKFAPFTMNRKHNNMNIVEKKLLSIKADKNGISIFEILIGRNCIETNKNIIIKISLLDGLILVLTSSKKPIKNNKLQTIK